ncbi:RNA 2',3'-cyclic phosphodiesterase [Terasakiella sp. A23]|uniref:RNA 2',3'-cyclic phosphodiesterase n=1 Tax=Terasakiella sp. FCG-A23 TaxID=3080561 RepID=UPI0029548190|nr:RNA 2',3'-cyclic phosphodiesterase [Terasakiella sp. A23]MDV7340537.1 RNA 2',3'-cyclic phosphodiesterase [Terasakiella sp. A23]
MLRLFIGLELPIAIQDRLEPLCSGLRDARWVTPHNMHITLGFVGDVDEGAARDLHETLGDIRFDPFELYLSEVDCFAHKKQPTIVWAGVKGDLDALHHLYSKTLKAIELAGLEPERRKYKPHVTLARMKQMPKEKLLSYMEANNFFKTDSFEVSHFAQFRSHLTRHGADYEVLARYGSDPSKTQF